jgi:hypothetical protein
MNQARHQTSDLPFAVDAAVIFLVSLAICFWSRSLLLMSLLVPALIAARMGVLARFAGPSFNLRAEALFLLICTILGAFNDWNSVARHRIYDYTVPHEFEWSTIPIWMLLYWGMILRFFSRIARWHRLSPPERPSNTVGFGRFSVESAPLRIILLLLLVFTTRRQIYIWYLDPVRSWLPFAFGLLFFLFFFRPATHDFKLIGLSFIGGPLIEVIYIHAGGLHRYHLGWFFGVPLWIILWWVLAVLIWKDIGFRIEEATNRLLARTT